MHNNSYNTSAIYILHAVGPFWDDFKGDNGPKDCQSALEDTYFNVFQYFENFNSVKYTSIGLPVISLGIYKVPFRLCFEAFQNAVIKFSNQSNGSLKTIQLVHNDNN